MSNQYIKHSKADANLKDAKVNIDIINTSTGEAIEIDVTGSLLSGSGTTED